MKTSVISVMCHGLEAHLTELPTLHNKLTISIYTTPAYLYLVSCAADDDKASATVVARFAERGNVLLVLV